MALTYFTYLNQLVKGGVNQKGRSQTTIMTRGTVFKFETPSRIYEALDSHQSQQ